MRSILLVGPSTQETITNTRWVTAPLGIHYLASWLNTNGHHAEVWDTNLDEDFEERVKRGYRGTSWNIIGFSVLEASMEYDLAKIHLAKKISPSSILVAGGSGASLNYQTFFDKSPLNIVVQSEGEYPLLQLCGMLDEYGYEQAPLHTIPGLILRNCAKVLSPREYQDIRKFLDIPAMRSEEYWQRTATLYETPPWEEIHTFRLFTSNYCPMGCAFCTLTRLRQYACGGPVKVVGLEVPQIIHLIQQILKNHPQCEQIYFVDDDFLLMKDRAKKFCEKAIQLKSTGAIPSLLRFLCASNLNRLSEDNVPLLAQAGFRVINIGAESLSQRVLDSLEKKQDIGKIWDVTQLLLFHGIRPYYTLILFTPYGNLQDLLCDLQGFKQLGEMGAGLSIEPYLIPLKGTRLAEERAAERVYPVPIAGTRETLYKGFAWLPMDGEVRQIFDVYENLYPKYRKLRMGQSQGTHMEKNWQATLILEVAALSLYKVQGRVTGLEGILPPHADDLLSYLSTLPNCHADIVGNVQ